MGAEYLILGTFGIFPSFYDVYTSCTLQLRSQLLSAVHVVVNTGNDSNLSVMTKHIDQHIVLSDAGISQGINKPVNGYTATWAFELDFERAWQG